MVVAVGVGVAVAVTGGAAAPLAAAGAEAVTVAAAGTAGAVAGGTAAAAGTIATGAATGAVAGAASAAATGAAVTTGAVGGAAAGATTAAMTGGAAAAAARWSCLGRCDGCDGGIFHSKWPRGLARARGSRRGRRHVLLHLGLLERCGARQEPEAVCWLAPSEPHQPPARALSGVTTERCRSGPRCKRVGGVLRYSSCIPCQRGSGCPCLQGGGAPAAAACSILGICCSATPSTLCRIVCAASQATSKSNSAKRLTALYLGFCVRAITSHTAWSKRPTRSDYSWCLRGRVQLSSSVLADNSLGYCNDNDHLPPK